jgi:hypothetical protein
LADPDAVLAIDETAELKAGEQTVAVAPQYAGVTGQVENCQTVVFLAYVTARAHALMDFLLYLPKTWISDPDRGTRAHVPDTIRFATRLKTRDGAEARSSPSGRGADGETVDGTSPRWPPPARICARWGTCATRVSPTHHHGVQETQGGSLSRCRSSSTRSTTGRAVGERGNSLLKMIFRRCELSACTRGGSGRSPPQPWCFCTSTTAAPPDRVQ